MLDLKNYQRHCVEELREFLKESRAQGDPDIAFYRKTHEKYRDLHGDPKVPFVCIRVPTGGGKTLIAAHAVALAFEHYLVEKQETGLVLWLVPTDSIRSQTLAQLRNRTHPYREALDHFFPSRVRVMDIIEARSIKPSDVTDNVCVIVTTLASIRREDTEGLKLYAQNGSLMEHFRGVTDENLFKTEDGHVTQSLANVIRMHKPLIILDEGHNAQTELSVDVIGSFLPSCILEFTATPLQGSNILVSIPAVQLKQEEMVKIPIHLENITQWQEAVRRAKEKRDDLEQIAKRDEKETKEYIRPLLLLQAEIEQEREDKVHVHLLLNFLTEELHIPREEIAIKTGKEDELSAHPNLLSRKCPIRYVITCNALKEGWDCSFAYALVSASNMGTRLSVEQIIGRVLRLPYAKRKRQEALNRSYVFTSSRRFDDAARAVVEGLSQNGYSKHDVIRSDSREQRTDYETARVISDASFSLPLIAINGQPLDFYDLIPEDFSLHGNDVPLSFLEELENQATLIDVQEDAVTIEAQQRLKLLLLSDDETKEALIRWLSRTVRDQAIAIHDMTVFLANILEKLLKKHSLETLFAQKFSLRDSLRRLVETRVSDEAEKTFQVLLQKKKITPSTNEDWHVPTDMTLLHPQQEPFKKHLFDRCDELNGEEMSLAKQIDNCNEVEWWLRNVVQDPDGFFIQGFRPSRFYPDFIVRTKKGAWWVLEYKGADRIGSTDTTYKEQIGNIWSSVCGKGHAFRLVTAENMPNIIGEISSNFA